jgi:uncharacterized protein
MQAALRGERDADVPCDGCTACCRSSQFVHVGLDEADTLAHIPRQLLFPAPYRSDELVLGYDERGHCPMLVDDRCSIYAHRPIACRTYDCRVLAAAGVSVDDDKPAVAARVTRWVFSHPTEADQAAHDAVRSAAAALEEEVPSAMRRALLAVDATSVRQEPRA